MFCAVIESNRLYICSSDIGFLEVLITDTFQALENAGLLDRPLIFHSMKKPCPALLFNIYRTPFLTRLW